MTRNKLNTLYAGVPSGKPITTAELAKLGISADLAVHYVRAGWLKRLARGVYARPGEEISLYASLRLLESQFVGLHVGGKSALDWYGVRQYLSQQTTLHLYGWSAGRLPEWFVSRFPAEYHRKRLFNEKPDAPLHVTHFENRDDTPSVAAPERALLEMLSEVGIRQSLQEAQELAESCYHLRSSVLQTLLKDCASIKTVRLCLKLGRECSMPWLEKIDIADLPTGSQRPWVSRTDYGLLVLKA